MKLLGAILALCFVVSCSTSIVFNPIIRQIDRRADGWNERVPVELRAIPPGTPRTDVAGRMSDFGFELLTPSAGGWGAINFGDDWEQGADVYKKFAGTVMCNLGYYVVVNYGPDLTVESLSGESRQHGCL